jgi:hypothetical protein
MKRSDYVTDKLIDKNLKHLETLSTDTNNRISIHDYVDLEFDSLVGNLDKLLSERLEILGYIHIHGEIITIDESLLELNKNGGWLDKIKRDKEIIEKTNNEQKVISNLEIKKLIADTIKAEYDVEKLKSNRSMSIIAIIISGFLLLLELTKWSIELYKSSM